ncbi:hypothetical protein MMAD_15060 [Mycolicibacterium madagascariense]|uniref:Alanine, arginine and proline rich protein n=1 Tax=Mycolicibacterium madagascariense TaxID=212765 RepID=A0A7I7XE89_9MYCO|nr:hypothetical protein [Mycolicibacterium madagascariense]BBZ27211.1 hypothetical protein MMAD_15060 [Mycolicibacterium madagascariense]
MPPPHPPAHRTSSISPVIDYEPPPVGAPAHGPCPTPSPAAMRRPTVRTLRPAPAAATPRRAEPPLPRAAAVFADTALRRVLEVTNRRRPVAQLRPLLVPGLYDAVASMVAHAPPGAAVLQRIRLRPAYTVDGETRAAEVFATYTRGPRTRAIAGRVELLEGQWKVTALQIG